MTVDTLSLARELRETDLSSAQAEAIAAAIGRVDAGLPDTRADVGQLETQLRTSFQLLDHRLEAMEQRLNAKIEASRSSLLIWFVGVLIALGGLALAVAKL